MTEWGFNILSPAQAAGATNNGEYAISIGSGGIKWDVHLGQSPVLAEKGKEYTVSFDAYAATPRTISAFVEKILIHGLFTAAAIFCP